MRFSPRIALAVLTTALLGVSPAFAQQPAKEKAEAELKAAQEKLERLLKELAAQEKKAAEATKPPPVPPAPPTPPTPPAAAKPMIAWAAAAPAQGGDAIAALKTLAGSKDPKTAALAKELLEQLLKSTPKAEFKELHLELVPSGGKPGVFEYKVAPPASGAASKPAGGLEFKAVPVPSAAPGAGGFEFKIAPAGDSTPKTVERRVVVVGDKDGKPVEGRIVVSGEKLGDKTATIEVTKSVTAAGPSTLKLSADGKTAAVLAADGTITIYDVATGKETMKFGGKK